VGIDLYHCTPHHHEPEFFIRFNQQADELSGGIAKVNKLLVQCCHSGIQVFGIQVIFGAPASAVLLNVTRWV